jgi:hypothetical protein
LRKFDNPIVPTTSRLIIRSLSLAFLLATSWSGTPAWTQSLPLADSGTEAPPARMRGNLDQRVARLTQALQLSEPQQSAVRGILEQRKEQFWRIRHDPSLPGSERIERVRALQQATAEQIRGVLNDEQKKKYDPLAVRRLEPARGQRPVEDWLDLITKP